MQTGPGSAGAHGPSARPSPAAVAAAVLRSFPRSYSEELGIRPPFGPSALFRLLVMSLLMGARIRVSVAMRADRELTRQGWTTARAMAEATWEDRTRVLNRSGYARYDESTSRMLGRTSTMALERYGGDLRRLREAAGRDPATERLMLKEFPGVGDVGADIFFREVQSEWDEIYPFADRRALEVAGRLGLGESASGLSELAGGRDFTRLVCGLVRVGLERRLDAVMEMAAA